MEEMGEVVLIIRLVREIAKAGSLLMEFYDRHKKRKTS